MPAKAAVVTPPRNPPTVANSPVPSFKIVAEEAALRPVKATPKATATTKRIIIRYCTPPANGSSVIVTWPVSTNAMFVVGLDKETFDGYRKTLKWTEDTAELAQSITECPTAGDLVFAKYEGYWARALVQKVADTKNVLVAFFDYGNTQLMSWTELRHYDVSGDITR